MDRLDDQERPGGVPGAAAEQQVVPENVGRAEVRPAVLAGVPNLVAEEDLDAATSLLQATDWIAAAVGPVVGGALVSASGITPVCS